MIKLNNAVLNTRGDGLWSSRVAAVKITKLDLAYVDDDNDFGELRVYFDRRTWNIERDGLIYTDNLFIKELRKLLKTVDLVGASVDYSEQGLQGTDYVSCDVGKSFIKSWMKKVAVTV